MNFTSHIIVITRNYECYMLYEKGTKSNNRRLDLHIIELESYVGQVIKDMVVKGIKSTQNKVQVI